MRAPRRRPRPTGRSVTSVYFLAALMAAVLAVAAAVTTVTGAATELEACCSGLLQRLTSAPGMTAGTVPSLLILGFAKAGTTDLWGQLMANYGGHLFNVPKKKEVLLSVTTREHWRYEPGAVHLRMYWEKQMNSTGGAPFTLNAAPLLLSFAYDNYWIVDQVAKLNTDANLIMLLREPVSRTHSYYNWAYDADPGSHISQQQVSWDMTFAEAMTWELDLLEGIAAPHVTMLLEEMAASLGGFGGDNGGGCGGGGGGGGGGGTYNAAALDAYRDLVAFVAHAPPPPQADGSRRPRRNTVQCRSYILWTLYGLMMQPWLQRYRARPGKVLVLQSELFYERPRAVLSEVVAPFLFSKRTHTAARMQPVILAEDADGAGSANGTGGSGVAVAAARLRNDRPYLERSYMPPEVGCRLQRFFAPFTEALMAMLAALEAGEAAAFVAPPPGQGGRRWWADQDYCKSVV